MTSKKLTGIFGKEGTVHNFIVVVTYLSSLGSEKQLGWLFSPFDFDVRVGTKL